MFLISEGDEGVKNIDETKLGGKYFSNDVLHVILFLRLIPILEK